MHPGCVEKFVQGCPQFSFHAASQQIQLSDLSTFEVAFCMFRGVGVLAGGCFLHSGQSRSASPDWGCEEFQSHFFLTKRSV
mmetsp:Transcript_141122/g.260020  ORF Transcript_141122/g.260020 Transcript_141122/m.260020 type:complete len:81 (+) Transcript_141122:1054-1296(+)